jgi:hypothetical protein
MRRGRFWIIRQKFGDLAASGYTACSCEKLESNPFLAVINFLLKLCPRSSSSAGEDAMRQVTITTVVARIAADRVVDCVKAAAVVIARALNRQLNHQHLGQRMSWLSMPMLLLVSESSTPGTKPSSALSETTLGRDGYRFSNRTTGYC